MELFLAQNHAAMTQLPIAASILAAVAAIAGLFIKKREVFLVWAILSIVALVTVLPTIATGIAAARGRFNEDGKPYIQSGLIVERTPANDRVFKHQILGIGGTILACFLGAAAIAHLRGRQPSIIVIVLLAVLLAVAWGIGGHLGGEELWGPDTFPALK
jgi:hypothetical protein